MTTPKKSTAEKRLLKLINFIDKKADEAHFNMRRWLAHNDEPFLSTLHGKSVTDLTAEDMNDCGTVGCALGWGCVIPEFRKLGLHMEPGDLHSGRSARPAYGEHTSTNAGREFFQLSTYDARLLFDSNWHRSKTDWLRDARGLLKELESTRIHA